MEMVLRCVLKSVEDTNKRVDMMSKQILKSVKLGRRSMGLAMIGAGIAIAAYIQVKALEDRIMDLEDRVDTIEGAFENVVYEETETEE